MADLQSQLQNHLQNYLQFLSAKKFSPKTIKAIGIDLKYFIKWLVKKNITDISQINYQILFDYQEHLSICKSNLTGRSLAISTQARKLVYVRGLFNYLVKTDVILCDPAKKINLPRKPETIRWALLSTSDIRKIFLLFDLNTAIGCRNRAIMELLYTTGMRSGELCNLRLNDIEYENNIIRINAGKGNKDRAVPACGRALRFTEQYIKNIRQEFVINKSKDYIFLSHRGWPLRNAQLTVLLHSCGKKANLKKLVTPQSFRIACATHMLKNGADVRYIQKLLGHTSIDTSIQYLRLEKSNLKKAHSESHPREKNKRM